jgi:hypothetical protein
MLIKKNLPDAGVEKALTEHPDSARRSREIIKAGYW